MSRGAAVDLLRVGQHVGKVTFPIADKLLAHGGIVRPMGRPSTISMFGHDGDSVLATSTLGRANCLTTWWFPD